MSCSVMVSFCYKLEYSIKQLFNLNKSESDLPTGNLYARYE